MPTRNPSKQALEHYQQAQQQFEKILTEIDPHPEVTRLCPAQKNVSMLTQAVTDAQTDLTQALRLIQDYQYLLAANILVRESTERTYALILPLNLNTLRANLQKNQQIITIVNDLLKDMNKAK